MRLSSLHSFFSIILVCVTVLGACKKLRKETGDADFTPRIEREILNQALSDMRELREGLDVTKDIGSAVALLRKNTAAFAGLADRAKREYYSDPKYNRQDIFMRITKAHPAEARLLNLEFRLVVANLEKIAQSQARSDKDKTNLGNAVSAWVRSLELLNPPLMQK